MKKMQMLHQYLLGTGLVNAEQLNTIVTEGTVVFHAIGSPDDDVAFNRHYTVQLNISAYGGNVDKLDAALVWWLSLYQPELAGDANGYGFEADIVSSETVNLYALLPLTERVRYDRASDSMLNCVTPLVLDGANFPVVPMFVEDAMTGETWEVGRDAG